MNQAYHIARILTLLTALLLLAGLRYGHAQNSSAEPYIDSWHLYRVPMGNINNTVYWYLSNPNYNSGAKEELDDEAWVRIKKIDTDVDSASIEIKFVEEVFVNAGAVIPGTWTLTYEEHDLGLGACVAIRTTSIAPVDNNFYLAAESDDDDCNAFSGKVWDNLIPINSNVDGVVAFTVNMNKAANHHIRRWIFTGEIDVNDAVYSLADPLFTTIIGRTDNDLGAWNITWTSGNSFTLTVTVDETQYDSGYITDAVTFEARIVGPAINDVQTTLSLVSASAVSGENYTVVTDDNGDGKSTQQLTLRAIPATSIVSIYQ